MNPTPSKPTRKNLNRKFGILAIIGFATVAWIKLNINGSAGPMGAPETACIARDPLSHCSVELDYPIGYGLVFTPLMEDFS
jgi:hypothetical protein